MSIDYCRAKDQLSERRFYIYSCDIYVADCQSLVMIYAMYGILNALIIFNRPCKQMSLPSLIFLSSSKRRVILPLRPSLVLYSEECGVTVFYVVFFLYSRMGFGNTVSQIKILVADCTGLFSVVFIESTKSHSLSLYLIYLNIDLCIKNFIPSQHLLQRRTIHFITC